MTNSRQYSKYDHTFLKAMVEETDYTTGRNARSIKDIYIFDEMYFMGGEL